jgi:hypothetical protein
MKITREGLKLIMRIVLSCCTEIQHYKYLIKLLEGNELRFETKRIQEQFPSVKFYSQLVALAKSLQKPEVDEEVVAKFFGGREHESKVISELHSPDACGLSKIRKEQNLFLHLLLPVEITEVKKGICSGTYRNEELSVRIKSLISFKEDEKEISAGSVVLIHLASIVMVKLSKKLADSLLEGQRELADFMKAVGTFDGKATGLPDIASVTKFLMKNYNL